MSRIFHTHDGISRPQTQGRTIHWAARYDLFVFLVSLGQGVRLRSHTADLAHLTPGESVLDIGCGTGDLTFQVCRRVGPTGVVAGIDAAPEMIARARQKALQRNMAIDFRLEPVEALTFADQTFDVIVSSFVFHHLPEMLKQQGLSEIRRVLKPGGRLILVDFLRPSHTFHLHSASQIGLQDLAPLLQEAGFLQIERKRNLFPFMGALEGRTAKE